MTQDEILKVVAARIDHPEYHARLDADATFRDIGLCSVDGWSIAVGIEDNLNCELDWSRVERWNSVRDVIETVEAMTGITRQEPAI